MKILRIVPIGQYAGIVVKHKNFNHKLSIIYGSSFHPGKQNLFEVSCCYSRFENWEEVVIHLDKGCTQADDFMS